MAALLLSACAKEVRQPSEDSLMALEAFDLMDTIRQAYEVKGFKAMAKYCTEAGYKQISEGIKGFDSVELEFTPRWVDIEGGVLRLKVSWEGKWEVKGETTKEHGLAVFELKGEPFKLSRILRGSPFVYPAGPVF